MIDKISISPDLLPDSEDNIILVDKPAGISSFGVVAKVRGALKSKFNKKVKIGHTGTLDPFATGLLILLSGKMTKKSDEFLKKDKEYEATIKLGETSTTGDPEGEVAKINDKIPTESEVKECLNFFLGEIEQTVPKFSAVKINGRRAYDLARKGANFETPTRKVKIYDIELLEYNYPTLKIKTKVSSGTYIRTLGEDIGKKLETGAYLTALRRLKIDNFDVKDAIINLC
ncbi:MAG: tRNA pseudouridine(55) synthase TruB [Candidatus Saccharibacteria bacterium]|nr:tRNA pseudouridine(55) synthase TruB [Candidatus Saccharibacteria bacterium]